MSDIPMFLNGVTWEAVGDPHAHLRDETGLPYVTHSGEFEIMGHKMKCFRLSNGQAVFEKEDFERFCEAWFGDSTTAAPLPTSTTTVKVTGAAELERRAKESDGI